MGNVYNISHLTPFCPPNYTQHVIALFNTAGPSGHLTQSKPPIRPFTIFLTRMRCGWFLTFLLSPVSEVLGFMGFCVS